MAGDIIRPSALPNRASPVASEKVPVDNGATVGGTTIEALVNAGRPLASQAEAEAGVQATKAMTPLTTKQALYALGDVRFASAAQGALADSAVRTVVAGTNVIINATDPQNPIITSTGSAAVADGNKGDVTVSGSGAAWALNAGAVVDTKLPAFNSTTSPGAGKIAYRPTWTGAVAKPLIARFNGYLHVSEADAAGDAVTDDTAKIKAIVDHAADTSQCVLFDPANYKLLSPVVVEPGNWKSFKLLGVPTGNHSTVGLGTTAFITNGTYNAFVVAHDDEANENFRMENIGFYNQTADYSNPAAIKVIRGANNDRYISGWEFRHIATNGYAASFLFQGMNTTESADSNYFGDAVFDQCKMYNGGIGVQLSNAVLNLPSFYDCLWWDLRAGGFVLLPDGDVGVGNGFGSAIRANLHNPHFENVAGIFRTPPPSDGPTLNSLGDVIRNVFSITGRMSREYCGSTILPTTGEPFVIGRDTDLRIAADIDEGLGFGETTLPYLQPGCTASSLAPVRFVANGGRFLSKDTICAPIIRQSLPTGSTTTFTITTAEPSVTFAIKSYLSLSDGNAGYVEGWHRGDPATSTTSGKIVESLIGGMTVTYGSGGGSDVLTVAVNNTSGFTFAGELRIENLSSCSITTASVL